MATYRVNTPNGEVFEVNTPDGATEQDAIGYVQQNYETLRQQQVQQQPKEDQYSAWDAFQKNMANPIIQTYIKGKETWRGLTGQEQDPIDLAVSKMSAKESRESMEEHPVAGFAGAVPGYVAPVVAAGMTGGAPLAVGMGVATGAAPESAAAREQGAPLETQLASGTIGAVVGGAGIGLPATIKATLGKRMLFGGATNAALNYGEAEAQNKVLEDYPKLQRDPLMAAAIGAGVGAPVAGILGRSAKTNLPADEQAAFAKAESELKIGEEDAALAAEADTIAARRQAEYDAQIKAKEQPAMGPVERVMPTEEQGLTPARTEDVLAAQARENQQRINLEEGGGVFIRDPDRIQAYRDQPAVQEPTTLIPRDRAQEIRNQQRTVQEDLAWQQRQREAFQEPISPDLRRMQEDLAWEQRSDAGEPPMPSQRGIEMVKPGERTTYRPNLREATGALFDAIAEAAGAKLNFMEGEGFHKTLTDFVNALVDAGHSTYLKAVQAAKKIAGENWEKIKPYFKAAWDYTKSIQPGSTKKQSSRDFESFSKRWTEAGKTREEIDAAWKILSADRSKQNVAKAVQKIPGMKGINPIEQKPYEEAVAEFRVEADTKETALTDLFRSGGRSKAMQTRNALINWAVEKIYGTKRRYEVIQKRAEQEILSEMHKLKKTMGDRAFIEAITELQKVEGEAAPASLSPQAKQLADTIRKNMDALHKATEQVTGKPKVYRPNYLAAMFTGPYRSVVRVEGPDGKLTTIGVIAGRTMDDAREGSRYFKEAFPEAIFEEPKFETHYQNARFGKKFEELAIHNNELLDMFGENELSKQFMDKADEYYRKKMSKHLDYYQHFKAKKGVVGAEGSAPWRSALDNAHDLVNAQLKVLEDGWEWVAAQEAAKDIRKILKDDTVNQPNSKNYITHYFARAFNKDSTKKVDLTGVTDYLAKRTGIEPRVFNEASGLLRNFTMSAVLGWNPAFWFTQIAQVPDALARTISYLKDQGLQGKGGTWSMMYSVGVSDAAKAFTKNYEGMSTPGKYFAEYAQKAGTFDPHLIEHQRVGKLVPTTGMAPFKSFVINNLLNHPYKALDLFAKKNAQLTIELLESRTRATYYMSVAHWLHSAGYSVKDAAMMADKLTSTFFVDYHPLERPAIWDQFGDLGKYASAVSTFKINYLNQLMMNMKQGNARTLAATALLLWMTTGLQGMPGMEDIDSALATVTKGEVSPKDFLMKNTSDLLYYGALSEATGLSLQTKFSQANIFAGDALEFLYPLSSYWISGAERTIKMIKNPNEVTAGAALQHALPGAFKALPEKFMLTDQETKRTLNPNKLPDAETIQRDKGEWFARAMGTYGNEEFRTKERVRELVRGMTFADKRLKSKMEKLMYNMLSGDPEGTQEAIYNFIEAGGSKQAIINAAKQINVGKQVDSETLTLFNAAKQKNIEKRDLFQEYVENYGAGN